MKRIFLIALLPTVGVVLPTIRPKLLRARLINTLEGSPMLSFYMFRRVLIASLLAALSTPVLAATAQNNIIEWNSVAIGSPVNGAIPVYLNGCISTICNPDGSALSADSSPVVVAPDQTPFGVNTAITGGVTGGARTGVIVANASVPVNIASATTTQLVAASAGQAIYVTAYDVVASGSGNIAFEYGTGTNCGTGTHALTGPYPLTASGGLAPSGGNGPKLFVPAGNALCALTGVAVQYSGSVSYAQF